MLSLLFHEMKSRLIATLSWGIGLALFGTTYIFIYPQVEEQLSALADWEIYQAMGFDMGSFEGFLGSTVVLFIPVLLGIYVIINSTQTLAGEEQDGTLELLLAQPLRRWQVITAKAVALGLSTFLILVIVGTVNGFVLDWTRQTAATSITSWQLFRAVISGWPLVFSIAMAGLFLSAYLPTRRVASITLAVLFIVSYFTENFASHVESLAFFKPFTIFTYFDTSPAIFRDGPQVTDVAILLGAAVVCFSLAVISFRRRNITVAAWPWEKASATTDNHR